MSNSDIHFWKQEDVVSRCFLEKDGREIPTSHSNGKAARQNGAQILNRQSRKPFIPAMALNRAHRRTGGVEQQFALRSTCQLRLACGHGNWCQERSHFLLQGLRNIFYIVHRNAFLICRNSGFLRVPRMRYYKEDLANSLALSLSQSLGWTGHSGRFVDQLPKISIISNPFWNRP